jgi:hypothetical protein
VTIIGTNLTGATAVKFGATTATSFTVNSATSITAIAPAGTGTADITVTTAGGTSATSPADQFTYAAAPTVTGISPTSGPAAGGTSVTITGSNFTGATAVKFGATNATSFTVNSATQITATSPAGISTVDVTITTSGGTSATSAADQFTYAAPTAPAVTGVNPNTGPTTGGTAVVISGTNFSGASAVKFGNTNATSFSVIGPTQISAISPAGSLGSVDVTVVTPGGPSATSPADLFTYAVPADSLKLRALQLGVTKLVAQNSGQAISGAIADAIEEAFSDGGIFAKPGSTGVRFNFAADPDDTPDQAKTATASGRAGNAYSDGTSGANGAGSGRGRQASSRIDDAFAAIDQQMPRKAPPKMFREEKEWLFWIDVRGSGVDRWGSPSSLAAGNAVTQSTLSGLQLNALMGLTYKATPNFLVGVVGGYETFNYTEQDINGKLTGQGWTVGSYLGWRITPTIRYDAAVTYSGIGYDGTAGTAQGNFNGQRWMVSTGLTGNYKAAGFFIEPSVRVYALWENENAYVDSLGTQQASHDFATGRASAGVKASYPLPSINGIWLAPYLGLYGDYYFSDDNAAAILATGGVPLASTPLLQGWSARLTGGIGARLPGDAMLAIGGQYGGIGSSTQIWTVTAKAQVPFSAR